MTCASCARRVESALQKTPEVSAASVNVATDSARITVADGQYPQSTLAAALQAVEKAGYGVALRSTELRISGMTCASCAGRVEKALKRVPGVLQASVNLTLEQAYVQALESVSFATLAAAIKKAGYSAHMPEQADNLAAAPQSLPDWWPKPGEARTMSSSSASTSRTTPPCRPRSLPSKPMSAPAIFW